VSSSDTHALWLYTRTHHGLAFACSAGILGALLVLSTRTSRAIASWDGTSSTPLNIATLAGLGILAGTTWPNRGGQHGDSLMTSSPALVRRLHPLVITLVSCALVAVVTGGIYTSLPPILSATRAVLLWCSLAFLGVGTGREFLGWCLPVAYFMALSTVGYAPSGMPRWWNVPMQPFDHPAAWFLTAAAAVVASFAVWRAALR
jgi:hypothetical protein